jgi:hypothetical protein
MMPTTVATWYATSIRPRRSAELDSAMYTGAVTSAKPIATPRKNRAPSSQTMLGATADRAAKTT